MAARLPRRTRVPQPVVEVLRLCIVLAGAALGYQAAGIFPGPVGSLGPVALGVITGSGLGYAVGGIMGRGTVHAMSRTEHALRGVPAEQIVAGFFGALLGLLGGAAIAWPVFLIGQAAVAVPLFVFVLLACAMLGYRIGSLRRDSMIAMFGAGAGMAPSGASSPSVLPRLVDSSVAIDGRILEVVRAGFLGGRMVVIQPVLDELQGLADASDDLRRGKGRRGLQMLETLRREPGVEVEVIDDMAPGVPAVDAKLVRTALDTGWALLTLDSNLARSAALGGVHVLNLHALTLAMRPHGGRRRRGERPADQGRQGARPGGGLSRRRHDGGRGARQERSGPGCSRAGDECADDGQRSHGVRAPRGARRPTGRRSVTPAPAGGRGRCGALVPAAGRGERLGRGDPKALRLAGGVPLLVHAVRTLASAPSVDVVVVAAPVGRVADVRALLAEVVGAEVVVVEGGDERQESVRLALAALPTGRGRRPRARRGTSPRSGRADRGRRRRRPRRHRSRRPGDRGGRHRSSRSTPTARSSRRSTGPRCARSRRPKGSGDRCSLRCTPTRDPQPSR